jgi:light-regulated signal transduction histidine kinase (bacteriophytochrome)
MDGYETCRRLKEASATATIPVIFVTALSDDADEEKGLDAGAVDYLSKSASRSIIRARIRNHLARRLAEEELSARTVELERSNADLQSFAYAASHDLQAPLRTVISFLGLLQQRCGSQIDAEGKEFMEMAVGGARRMRSLIEGLLAFSRAGSGGLTLESVEPAEVVRGALDNLHQAITDSGAQVVVGDLPPVVADFARLSALFQNLIGNAIKYRVPGKAPQVEVGVDSADGKTVFFVRDDGIGIPPESQADIFGIFRRLHGDGTYPGSGIGLALCKRIVELHGGRIWVESEAGKGSTFRFVLGRPPAAE